MFKGVDFKGLVTLDYFPRVEHLQALQEERDALIAAICRRLEALPRQAARRDAAPAPRAFAGFST